MLIHCGHASTHQSLYVLTKFCIDHTVHVSTKHKVMLHTLIQLAVVLSINALQCTSTEGLQ